MFLEQAQDVQQSEAEGTSEDSETQAVEMEVSTQN